MDISKMTTNLELHENGIWFSKDTAEVSYPDEGNKLCFEIEKNSFWFEHRNKCITTIIEQYHPPGTVFDVGGGNGIVASAIQNMGIEVVLVEPGKTGAINSKQNGIQSVICSTLEGADFQENSIPAIGLFDVIEHIENDLEFLATIKRLLIPGGKLYITVPAYDFLWSNEDKYADHFRRYTSSALKEKLNTSGYNIVYSTYIFSYLLFPILFFRAIPSRLGFRKTINIDQEINEHRPPSGFIGGLLHQFTTHELHILKNKKAITFGGSCLAVAEKI